MEMTEYHFQCWVLPTMCQEDLSFCATLTRSMRNLVNGSLGSIETL